MFVTRHPVDQFRTAKTTNANLIMSLVSFLCHPFGSIQLLFKKVKVKNEKKIGATVISELKRSTGHVYLMGKGS